MASRGTNVPPGRPPQSDWYDGHILVAPHFAFTPCLTALRHAYGNDTHRTNWVAIAASVATATRQIYSKHELTQCRKYGLYIAGGKEEVKCADRERMMVFVIELVKSEVHRWKDIDADARRLLRDFELSSVSNDDHGDHGVCVRYYVHWDGPRDLDFYSRMSRRALTSDYGLPSFAQPDDEEPPNVPLLRTARQVRHEQEAAVRSQGRRRAPIRTPAIPNERIYDDAYDEWHTRQDSLAPRGSNSRAASSRIETQQVEDIASAPRDSVHERDVQAVVPQYQRARRRPREVSNLADLGAQVSGLLNPLAAPSIAPLMPIDGDHSADHLPADIDIPAWTERGLEIPWREDYDVFAESQAEQDRLFDTFTSSASNAAESERDLERIPSSSHAASGEDAIGHVTHPVLVNQADPACPHLGSTEDLKLDFEEMVKLFGEDFRKRHMSSAHTSARGWRSREWKSRLRLPMPAIEFR